MATAPPPTGALANDPFKAIGGGVWTGSGWIPANHPDAAKYKSTTTTAQPGTATTPAAPKPTTIAGAGAAAQTYSGTPGAAPAANTTNQGTQDVVRNSYLQQALQKKTIDMNDPVLRQQADTFAAAQERARRDAVADNAERFAGTGQVGAQNVEERMLNERAAQSRAGFEAQLVGRELQNRRDEIQNALTNLSDLMSQDQARALQKELGQLDAQLKQAGISSSERLGNAELALKSKLGMGGLNIDLQRLLMQNQQFNKDLGFRIGDAEAGYNQRALAALLGG